MENTKKSLVDSANEKGTITRFKYTLSPGETEAELIKRIDSGKAIPEIHESENIWLTTGWTEILGIITGLSANHFNATNATIGVSTDTTAASAGQTDLIGATKVYKGMSSSYPTSPAGGTVQFKARFLTTEANYLHAEIVLKNTVSGVCWNRALTAEATPKTATDIFDWLITLGTA